MDTYESYVSFETAEMLKVAGFDWEVNTCYYNSSPDKVSSNGTLSSNFTGYAFQHIAFSAPTFDVAQRWLREVKNCYAGVEVFVHNLDANNIYYTYNWVVYFNGDRYSGSDFNTSRYYEVAQEAGIKKALKYILKDKEDGRNTNN